MSSTYFSCCCAWVKGHLMDFCVFGVALFGFGFWEPGRNGKARAKPRWPLLAVLWPRRCVHIDERGWHHPKRSRQHAHFRSRSPRCR